MLAMLILFLGSLFSGTQPTTIHTSVRCGCGVPYGNPSGAAVTPPYRRP